MTQIKSSNGYAERKTNSRIGRCMTSISRWLAVERESGFDYLLLTYLPVFTWSTYTYSLCTTWFVDQQSLLIRLMTARYPLSFSPISRCCHCQLGIEDKRRISSRLIARPIFRCNATLSLTRDQSNVSIIGRREVS
jgi:hypothetical protein